MAPEDNSGNVLAEAGQRVGEQVQQATIKFSDSLDTIQATRARANIKAGILDIQNRAQNDPDYNNSQKYFREMDDLKRKSLKGFTSNKAGAEFAIEADYETKVAQIQLDNLFKKKIIDVGQTSALELIEQEANNPNAGSLERIKSELSRQVKAGIFDHKDAYKLYQNSEQKIKFNSFLQDFRSDPIAAEKKFNKTSYGMDIETQERARVKLRELKTMQREQEGNIFSDMSLRVTTGEIDDDEINAAIAMNKQNPNEGITEAHGKQLLAARYRDITKRIGTKEYAKHRKAIDFIFSDSSQDRVKGYEAVLEAYADGLSTDETKFLQQIIETKKDIIFANKAAAGKKMIEQLFGARAKNVQEETRALLLYAKRIADKMEPDEAARATALDIVQKDHPATIADPDLVGVFTPSKGFKNIQKVKRERS